LVVYLPNADNPRSTSHSGKPRTKRSSMTVETVADTETGPNVSAVKIKKIITVVMIVGPFIGLVLMGTFGWPYGLALWVIGLTIGMHLIAAGGVTVGFHRHLTHRAFETFRPVKILLVCCGSLAIEGPVINWVANHRQHHTFTDEEGDPHSPHVGIGAGIPGILKGLWHAHWGWLISSDRPNHQRFAPDLLEDPAMVWASRLFRCWR
jgi:stearoyl-CoA desaturase (Delta-9 desaturase)